MSSGADLGRATGYIDLDISAFLTGLSTAQAQAKSASKSLTGAFSSIGTTLTGVGKSMTALATGPILALGGTAVTVASNFEAALSKVTAVSGTASDAVIKLADGSMTTLKDKAMEMGSKTKFSASEAADAMYYMGLAGWDAKSMVEGLDGVMNLAAASGEDLGTTSDIVTDALTAFGMKASDASRFADILATTSSKSNTNVGLLGESFKYVAPLCGAMGYSAEDCATALGMMANSGIKGSQAGTTLKTALANLAKPTDAQAQMMDQLGISIVNSDGSMKSMADVMTMLRQRFSTLSADQKVAAAATLFGKESMAGMLSIVNDSVISMDELSEHLNESGVDLSKYGWTIDDVAASYNAYGDATEMASDLVTELGMSQQDADKVMQAVNASLKDGGSEWDKLNGSIKNCTGSAEDMANTMNDNLQGQLTILKSTLETVAIQFGDMLVPVIKKVVEKVQEFSTWLTGLNEQQRETIIKIAATVAAIGPVLLIGGKLISGIISLHSTIGTLGTAFTTIGTRVTAFKEAFALAKGGMMGFATQTSSLGAALGGLGIPIAAIVAAIAALVGAFVYLWNTNEDFRNNITAIWQEIKVKFEEFGQGIVDRLNALGFDFENFTEVVKAIWDGFCAVLAPVFEGVFNYISIVIGTVLDVITGILDVFIGLFTGNWDQCWNGIKGIFEAVWNGMKDWFTNILNVIKGVFDVVLGWFGTSWDACWNSIKSFFEGIWNGIVSFFTGICESIKGIFQAVCDFISNVWNIIYTTVSNIVSAFVSFILEHFGAFFENVRGIFQGVHDVIKGIWETIKNVVLGIVLLFIDLVTGNFKKLKEDAIGIFNNLKNAATSIWNGIKEVVVNFVMGLVNGVVGFFKSLRDTVSGIWNAIKNFASSVWNGLVTTVTSLAGRIKDGAVNAFQNMKTSIKNKVSQIKDDVVKGFNNAINFITSLPSKAIGWGKDFINGLIDGIKGMIGKVGDAVEGVADKIKSFLHFSRPDVGPLREYEEWMPDMVQGLSKSLKKSKPNLLNTVKSVAQDVAGLLDLSADVDTGKGIGYISAEGFKRAVSKDSANGSSDNKDKPVPVGGNTYIFNSQAKLSEVECREEMKKAEQEIAYGF